MIADSHLLLTGCQAPRPLHESSHLICATTLEVDVFMIPFFIDEESEVPIAGIKSSKMERSLTDAVSTRAS